MKKIRAVSPKVSGSPSKNIPFLSKRHVKSVSPDIDSILERPSTAAYRFISLSSDNLKSKKSLKKVVSNSRVQLERPY